MDATIEVPNPHRELVPQLRTVRGTLAYHEDRIRVERSLRDDPLGQMHARKQITHVQYRAGREWQRYAEMAGTSLRSPGYIEEPVDGSPHHRDGVTEAQKRATKQRAVWRDMLGGKPYCLLEAVLIDKSPLKTAGMLLYPDSAFRYVGWQFRVSLDQVGRDLGLLT